MIYLNMRVIQCIYMNSFFFFNMDMIYVYISDWSWISRFLLWTLRFIQGDFHPFRFHEKPIDRGPHLAMLTVATWNKRNHLKTKMIDAAFQLQHILSSCKSCVKRLSLKTPIHFNNRRDYLKFRINSIWSYMC